MDFAHFVLHRPYHEYFASTTPEQRTAYYEHYVLHNLKESYWNTLPEKRPGFGMPEVNPEIRRMDLDAMIEASLERQRELNAQAASQNGTKPKRRRKTKV